MTRWVLSLLVLVSVQQARPSRVPTLRDLVGTSFAARITAISDGDTVDALPEGEKRAIRLRLDGIDTPERGEPFSQAARAFTRVLLFDGYARVEGRDVDRYGRLVARVRVGGQDASVALVRAGLACHYTTYSSDSVLAGAEGEARRAGRGFWARGAPKPRCALREQPAGPRGSANSPRGGAAPSAFHGNTESHVYHAPSCRNFNCRDCTRVFATEAAARAAGFRPATDCLRDR